MPHNKTTLRLLNSVPWHLTQDSFCAPYSIGLFKFIKICRLKYVFLTLHLSLNLFFVQFKVYHSLTFKHCMHPFMQDWRVFWMITSYSPVKNTGCTLASPFGRRRLLSASRLNSSPSCKLFRECFFILSNIAKWFMYHLTQTKKKTQPSTLMNKP